MGGIMNRERLRSLMARRSFLSRLRTGVGILGAAAVSAPGAMAEVGTDASWRPGRHEQDDWLDKIPGQHRFVFDTTTADGMGLALRFAFNYFTANQTGYGLKDGDLAVVLVLRHKATAFGYKDAIWAKYGKPLSDQAEFVDPKTKQPPTVNFYAVSSEGAEQFRSVGDLIKRGAHFGVCQMATRNISGRIARATGGDADAIFKELSANLIDNARLVPAGIVAVNRAQERGYSFAHAI
jgi:hypothetical protein